jgi:hypothetical protein
LPLGSSLSLETIKSLASKLRNFNLPPEGQEYVREIERQATELIKLYEEQVGTQWATFMKDAANY